MLTNFLLGLPTMVMCLMLQTALLVLVIRYFYKHTAFISTPIYLITGHSGPV